MLTWSEIRKINPFKKNKKQTIENKFKLINTKYLFFKEYKFSNDCSMK